MIESNRGRLRRSFLKTTGVTLIGGATAGCLVNTDGGGDVELTIADWVPEGHQVIQDNLLPWIDEVKSRSETDLTFDLRTGGEIGGSGEMLSIAREGIADIAMVGGPYFDAQLPLSQVLHLPGTFTETAPAMEKAWDMSQGVLHDEEFSELGLQVVNLGLEPPYQLGLATESKVVEVDDWNGLNVRSPGGMGSLAITNLGGTPVDVRAEDTIPAFESGTLDSNIAALDVFLVYGLDSFFNYVTTNVNLSSFAMFYVMAEDAWNELPEDIQNAMLSSAKDRAPEVGRTYDANEDEAAESFADAGVEPYQVPAEAYTGWMDILEPVHNTWIEEKEEAGLPAQEVYDEFESSWN
jgi:TRAP-type C4-dicarboxylate transport system substrate-binding protein